QLGNRSVEGGLKVPYSLEVTGWDLSAQTELDFLRDEVGAGHHPEFFNSLSVGRHVIGRLSYYVEFFSVVSTERNSDWIGSFATWVTYQINENLRFDAGVYIGVTDAAYDWHPFAGMTWRF